MSDRASNAFRVLIRLVFLGAYGAFLWASLHHVAYFFQSFEADQIDWTGSYWLAISIDVTALVLTIGVMFFYREMGRVSFVLVWFFIIGLTAFSWVVNWEYAVQFQNASLNRAIAFQSINPVFASGFTFLNLVYSIVAKFFDTKAQTSDDLDNEIARLIGLKDRQKTLKELRKGTGLIATFTEVAKDMKHAATEIRQSEQKEVSALPEYEQIAEQETCQITPSQVLAELDTQLTEEEVQLLDTQPEQKAIEIVTAPKRPKVSSKKRTPGKPYEKKAWLLWVSNPEISGRTLAAQIGTSPTTATTLLKRFRVEQQMDIPSSNGHGKVEMN